MTLIDGDSYEEHNAERQEFTQRGNKAEVTADSLRNNFPGLSIWTTTDYLTEDNIGMIVRDGDLVFSCVDNHATRLLLSNRCCDLDNAVLISGGNEYADGNCQVHVRKDGKDLTLPVANDYHPEIQRPADINPGDPQLRRQGCGVIAQREPQLIFTNFFVAASMVAAFYKWTEDGFATNKYDEVYVDLKLNKMLPKVRNGGK